MENTTDDQPSDPDDQTYPAWGHVDDDEEGSTWELYQDEGRYPPGVHD